MGATIAAVVVCIIALATGGVVDCIVLAVFFIVYQQFENNVLQNLVYSKTLALSPLVIFVAALIGATLAGLVGVLLAIPLAAAAWDWPAISSLCIAHVTNAGVVAGRS